MAKIPLPIDPYLEGIAIAIQEQPCLILQASPGSGKTTRVPPALLDAIQGKILVLEPRRIAARLSAQRVAEELGEDVGRKVGFSIRFESRVNPDTRIEFITEGLLVRRMMVSPTLDGVGCIILDEFHERHLQTDVAMMLVRELQKTKRPDLKLIVMSATLDLAPLKQYLGEDQTVAIEAPVFPVSISYQPRLGKEPLENAVEAAVKRLLGDTSAQGDILVFLPGSREIKRCAEKLRDLSARHQLEVLPLKADLTKQEQDLVFAKSSRKKVILATNVAETSVTIPGVTGVIDSGLAKIAGHAHWSGMPTLDTKAISQSSCIQRAGRAGRTAPGSVIRLFAEADYLARVPYEKPEIQRLDLTQLLLDIEVIQSTLNSFKKFNDLPWFDMPDEKSVQSCLKILGNIGALDSDGNLTPLGKTMGKIPLHPRLSRLILEGEKRGIFSESLIAAGMMSEGMPLRYGYPAPQYESCDVGFMVEILRRALSGENLDRDFASYVDWAACRRVESLCHQIANILKLRFELPKSPVPQKHLAACLLSAFPDRVAQRRKQSKSSRIELNLAGGGGALLSQQSTANEEDLIIAIEAEEQVFGGDASQSTIIKVAAALDFEVLLEDPAGFLRDEAVVEWDQNSQRVRGFQRTYYDKLAIEETPRNISPDEAEEFLCKILKEYWPKPFESDADLKSYRNRVELLKKFGFEANLSRFEGEDFDLLLAHICEGKKSFHEISEKSLAEYILELLPYELGKQLERLLPSAVAVGHRRRVPITYEEDKAPWIASRLQDFFGMNELPKLLEGRLPLVAHLLSPRGIAVQVTQDLSGFWKTHYPSIRKELSRQYPRHPWPEDPLTAEPPMPRPGRGSQT